MNKYSKKLGFRPMGLLGLMILALFLTAPLASQGLLAGQAQRERNAANYEASNEPSNGQSSEQDSGQSAENHNSYALNSVANWQEKTIDITISVPIPRLEMQSRYYANGIIDINFSVWLYDSVKDIQINSQQTLKDFWGGRLLQKTYSFFKDILQKKHAVFDPKMQYFRASYQVPLYPDLVKIWAGDSYTAEPLTPAILAKNATEYTGLILYAADKLPIHGQEYSQAKLKPALFPRIYNEYMKLLVSYQNIEKQALLQSGMLSYAAKADADKYRDLIGSYPLRILVRQVFGSAGTDMVIDNADAEILLTNPSMREALRQGRILILQDTEPQMTLVQDLDQ